MNPNLDLTRLNRPMTFRELRDHLNEMDESSLDLPVYVYDGENHGVSSMTLFDSDAPHDDENPLAFNVPDFDERD